MNQPVSNVPRSCEELGVCQLRAECHIACDGPPGRERFPFAPGVLVGYRPSLQARLRRLLQRLLGGN